MLKSLEEHNSSRRELYSLQSGAPVKNGIACPNCGDELSDTNPNITLTSNPPKKTIRCGRCGYSGSRIA